MKQTRDQAWKREVRKLERQKVREVMELLLKYNILSKGEVIRIMMEYDGK